MLPDGRDTLDRLLASLRRGVDVMLSSDGATLGPVAPPIPIVSQHVSKPNVVAVMSPKGGVGKTTCALLAGSVLAGPMNLRVLVVDAGAELGTLNELVPRAQRVERPLDELIAHADEIRNAAELRPYVACLPSGLHVLGAPREAMAASQLSPEIFATLVDFLAVFYEVVVLDLGTGLLSPSARYAVERADQLVLVTTPDKVTATVVGRGLAGLPRERTTAVVNMAQAGTAWDDASTTQRLRERGAQRTVTIPFDEDLLVALDSGSFALETLGGAMRAAIERLGRVVGKQLV